MPHDPKAESTNVNALAAGPARTDAANSPSTVAKPPRRFSSDDLFAGAREIAIDHNGRRYQLRITQSGKLILTA